MRSPSLAETLAACDRAAAQVAAWPEWKRSLHMKPKTPRDPSYLTWLRTLPCVFCDAPPPCEASHHGPSGMGTKASDYGALPACRQCHQRWHDKGSPHITWDDCDKYQKRDLFAALARAHLSLWAAVMAPHGYT